MEIDSIHIYVGYVVALPHMVSDLELQYLCKSIVLGHGLPPLNTFDWQNWKAQPANSLQFDPRASTLTPLCLFTS